MVFAPLVGVCGFLADGCDVKLKDVGTVLDKVVKLCVTSQPAARAEAMTPCYVG